MNRYRIVVNEMAYQAIKNNALTFFDQSQTTPRFTNGIKEYEFPVDPDVFAYLKDRLEILTVDNVSALIIRMAHNKQKEDNQCKND